MEPGEIVGFLGPNGAGKTTAIHVALGITRATSGNGMMLGSPLGDARARRRIGFLAESPAFYHRSAKTILRLYGALNGVREPELSSRATNLLEQVGLGDEAERNVGKFSRGMLQRVGIAQAFMNDPDLLILDEPTSALDPISRHQVRELLRAARDRGKSVFLSSHQLSEVELICDRVFFVHQGRIVGAGRTQELLASSDEFEIVANGIAAPPAYAREVSRDSDQIRFTVAAKNQQAAIQDVWLQRGTLIRVTPKTRSLEEIFLELVDSPSQYRFR